MPAGGAIYGLHRAGVKAAAAAGRGPVRPTAGSIRSNCEKNVSYNVCFFLDTQAPWPYIGPVNARNAPAAAHGRLSRCPECRSLRRRSARTGAGRRRPTWPAGRVAQPVGCHPFGTSGPHAVDRPERGCRKKMSISRPVFLTGSNSGICRAAPAAMPVFSHFRRAPAPARHFDRSGFENHGIEKMFL